MTKKIHSKNDFELCLLRHQYLRKANINPTREQFRPYQPIVVSQANKTYAIYKKLFYTVGLDFADVVRIGETQIVSFLGLFHIEHDKSKYDKFVEAFAEKNSFLPVEGDVLDKNKAIFTIFLKQRMEDLVRVCRQKVKNVRGSPMQEFHYFSGTKLPEKFQDLVRNWNEMGFRKVDPAIFRSIKKKAKPDNDQCFNHENTWYIAIPTGYRPLAALDFINAGLDPRDSTYNKSPEDLVILSEDVKKWEREYKKYKKISREKKLNMLNSFIEDNKNNTVFKEELKTARKILNRME